MNAYTLTTPQFMDPRWFSWVRSSKHPATVAEDGTVTVEGEALQFHGEAPAAGTAVRVWLGSQFFLCATEEDIARDEQERLEKKKAEDESYRQRRNTMRDKAAEFNARFNMPFQWDVGIKVVLSGLSEYSNGCGRNQATVHHIMLLEDFQGGRLRRKKLDFLCTSASGSNGGFRDSGAARNYDGNGEAYQPKVTCRACLKLASKWIRE